MIAPGLENPTPDVSKAIAEVEVAGKGRCFQKIFVLLHQHWLECFTSQFSLITSIFLCVSHMLSYTNQKPTDNLTKLAALDMDILFSKTKCISKGVLFNVQQSLLREWGSDSLGVLPEDIMQELLTGVTL